MYKSKMKLLYNEKYFFCIKTELLNFKLTMSLVMMRGRLVSNGLIFSGDTWVNIQLVTLGWKLNNFDNRHSLLNMFYLLKNYALFVSSLTVSDNSFSSFLISTCFVLFQVVFY